MEDSIDISGCKHLHTSVFNEKARICNIAESVGLDCYNIQHCYYKQLKRKEDECNRYKQVLKEIRKECKCFGRSTYTQEYDRIYGGQLDTNIIETINEILEDE